MARRLRALPSDLDGVTDYEATAELFAALSAPVRIALVDLLSRSPRPVKELVDELDIPQPLVSQHLRILRKARVVVSERHGRESYYQLTDAHIARLLADALSHAAEPRSDWTAMHEIAQHNRH